MQFMSAINPKLYDKTCCSLLIMNFAWITVSYNKYEYVCDVVVTVNCTVYTKLVSVTSYKFTL